MSWSRSAFETTKFSWFWESGWCLGLWYSPESRPWNGYSSQRCYVLRKHQVSNVWPQMKRWLKSQYSSLHVPSILFEFSLPWMLVPDHAAYSRLRTCLEWKNFRDELLIYPFKLISLETVAVAFKIETSTPPSEHVRTIHKYPITTFFSEYDLIWSDPVRTTR